MVSFSPDKFQLGILFYEQTTNQCYKCHIICLTSQHLCVISSFLTGSFLSAILYSKVLNTCTVDVTRITSEVHQDKMQQPDDFEALGTKISLVVF